LGASGSGTTVGAVGATGGGVGSSEALATFLDFFSGTGGGAGTERGGWTVVAATGSAALAFFGFFFLFFDFVFLLAY
jgi:hypothetical protein